MIDIYEEILADHDRWYAERDDDFDDVRDDEEPDDYDEYEV